MSLSSTLIQIVFGSKLRLPKVDGYTLSSVCKRRMHVGLYFQFVIMGKGKMRIRPFSNHVRNRSLRLNRLNSYAEQQYNTNKTEQINLVFTLLFEEIRSS
jgi:hypothetical protein